MKKMIFILFVTLLFIINTGKGQSYALTSLEGRRSKINLYYKPASGTLRISHMKDMHISVYSGPLVWVMLGQSYRYYRAN